MANAVFAYLPAARIMMEGDLGDAQWTWHWWANALEREHQGVRHRSATERGRARSQWRAPDRGDAGEQSAADAGRAGSSAPTSRPPACPCSDVRCSTTRRGRCACCRDEAGGRRCPPQRGQRRSPMRVDSLPGPHPRSRTCSTRTRSSSRARSMAGCSRIARARSSRSSRTKSVKLRHGATKPAPPWSMSTPATRRAGIRAIAPSTPRSSARSASARPS